MCAKLGCFSLKSSAYYFNMKSVLGLFIVHLYVAMIGCHSSQSFKQMPLDSVAILSHRTAIKSNVSSVTGVINGMTLIDSVQYSVSLHINSVQSKGLSENFAEEGQDVTLAPQFVVDEKNSVDVTNERNKKLLRLRYAKAGDTFNGKISLSSNGKWVIIDVESH